MKQKAYYHDYLSPAVGWLELCVSDKGLRSIAFIKAPSVPRKAQRNPVMKQLIAELDRYFQGEPVKFSVPIDPSDGTPFQRKVWAALAQIPYGQTESYAELAARVGNRRGARAVGGANGKNPIPIVVPCHRVIKADGSLGGYSSGTKIKKKLLKLEGIRL